MLSREVEQVVERAILEAQNRKQEFATVEHLCLTLFDHEKIESLLKEIGVSSTELKSRFKDYIDNQIESLPKDANVETLPSLGFQRVLKRAAVHVVGAGKEEVLCEHVLVSVFDEDESYAVFMLQQSGVTRLDLVSILSHGGVNFEDTKKSVEYEYEASEYEPIPNQESALEKYTVCLTDEAAKGRLDTLIGRTAEINRAILILSRRRKNNPLFVGEPGVGKTALAEGIAQRIVEKDVPDFLKDAQMYLLDMGAMLAGARYRGDFENRMKAVIKAINAKKNAIMVIDEIHTVIGAGATSGSSMDASNLLKPVLANGQLRCIGSTTHKEFRMYFEKDRALLRRFLKVEIKEPSVDECLKILRGIKKRYEEFHKVTITDDALKLAIDRSVRYLFERQLPDKAIDLLDEACCLVKLNNNDSKKWVVDESAIEKAISIMANVPSNKLNRNDKLMLKNLLSKLKAKIYGQDEAIVKIVNAILLSRAGLRESEKPIGSFLFSGPSGVGKTEVAKLLAHTLGVSFIRFDMSEYMERHAASRLVGAPPGYVGYEQGGLLTDAIHKNPYSVLLLDEIEKAHPDVFNMLLQVMDYGRLTDSNGRPCDFRHCIIIMTSNLGAREMEQQGIGFVEKSQNKEGAQVVNKFFSPEFRNRLDARVTFKNLSEAIMLKVVQKFIDELKATLLEKKVYITISNKAKEYLSKKGYDRTMGARPLARIITEKIKKPIAKEILFGSFEDGGRVVIDVQNNKLALKFEPKKQLVAE